MDSVYLVMRGREPPGAASSRRMQLRATRSLYDTRITRDGRMKPIFDFDIAARKFTMAAR